MLTTLTHGERLDVSRAPESGWRWATRGALEGYVSDADIVVTGPSGEAAPPGPAPRSEGGPVVTERRSYVTQMMGAYAPSLVLAAAAYGTGTLEFVGVAWLGLLLVPPIVHVAHANTVPALASLGVRVLIVGTVVDLVDHCINFLGPESDATSCDGLGVALLAEIVAMPIVDFALAHETVTRPGSSVGLVVSPLPGPRSGVVSGVVSVVGRF